MTAIRLSPSGPVIGNTDGGPLEFGPGARLRLTEANSVMGGSLAVPTPGDAANAVISPNGFGDPAAIVLTLNTPKQGLEYRAKLLLDLANETTNQQCEVTLYLDVSIDGGTSYVNVAKNAHVVRAPDAAGDVASARQAEVHLNLISGAALGITDVAPPASIKLRARAIATADATAGAVIVSSQATSGAETGLDGTIHMELEECF
jgi:hypothetical protein